MQLLGTNAFPAWVLSLLRMMADMRGVTDAGIVEHSKANAKLKEGLQKLGVHYGEIPRNTSTGHSCGHCSFGCAHGEKQDGTATFLADAVEAGARIITGEYLPWDLPDCNGESHFCILAFPLYGWTLRRACMLSMHTPWTLCLFTAHI